ncbi:porin [Variovorax terrae]|uniref:Porin n=1 Tax=Variovorax terrae TaxID=2923278 RepID=A0A9X2ASL5_9BURK|nr:porin [Variovorax terrae]MCJ0765501.1 porin [Variovorax terrae]
MNNWKLAPLALAAVCGCAQAQSSVTIFGRIDLSLRKTAGNSTQSGPGGMSTNDALLMVPASRNRWGIRVDEDLGGGWRGHVFLDATFNGDDGTAALTYFDGRSTVGISNPAYGRIDFGRIDQPALYITLDFDPWQGDTMGQAGPWSYLRVNPTGAPAPAGLPAAPQDFYSFKSSNSITYASPVLGGFQARAQYALSETPGTADSKGGSLTYTSGPFYAGIAHQRWNDRHYSTPIGAWYNFGFIKPMFSYVSGKRLGNKESNLLLGFTAVLGGGELRGLIERYTLANGSQHDRKWSTGYFYPLSKRTTLYGNYANVRFNDSTKRTGVELGVRHSF